MRRAFAWRKFGRKLMLAAFLIFMSGGLAWAINALFTIRAVEVSGDGIAVEVDQAKLPKNLLFFPTEQVAARIVRDNPLVGSVVIKKKYPATLGITAIPRAPFAVVGMAPETYAVDDQGVVLSQYPTARGLPLVRLALPPLQPGDHVSDQAALAALNFLRETAPVVTVSEIAAFEGLSLQAHAEGMSIRFTQDADMQLTARTLQTLLVGFRIKGTLPKTIDLRFDKPVVTF